ncbi:PID-CTERM protein-sorting domain-containing protein [Aquirufa regiilacus]|jgi:hypothetical protein
MKTLYKVLIMSVLVSFSTFADTDDVNLPVPIDGGISILLASGVAYGAKKIIDANKEKE